MASSAPPAKPPSRPGKRLLHGYWIPKQWDDWHGFLYLFGISDYGEDKLKWFELLTLELWPEPIFIRDEWTKLFFAACAGAKDTVERLTGVKIDTNEQWWRRVWATGSGASGKSKKAAMWVLCCWLYAQRRSTVVLTSTGMDQLKRRIWHALLVLINTSAHPLPLEPLPGDCEIRWAPGDKLSCIFGIPVKSGGEESEAIDRIKGLHNTETYLVIDEATAMPDAITEAERNLRKGTKRHQVIGLGNAFDHDDLHGRNMEPEGGWNSITAESVFWLNKLGGCSLHFDGHKSPRLRDDVKFHYYIGAEDIRLERKFNGGESNPRYWSEVRGFWPPSGLSNLIMDAALFAQGEVEKPAVWRSGFAMGGAFDGAWEGEDRAVFYPFKFGEFASGVKGLEFQEHIIVNAEKSEDKRWVHYGIADALEGHCKRLLIAPQNFCEDTTGEGGAFHAILSARWSPKVTGVEFGGAADKTPISPHSPRTWHEAYGNRVTMLWFLFRSYVEAGQIRGLTDAATRKELTSRTRLLKNGKIVAEPKKNMTNIGHKSCDLADACVIATYLLYSQGIMPAGMTTGEAADATDWNKFADRTNLEEDEHDYSDEQSSFAV